MALIARYLATLPVRVTRGPCQPQVPTTPCHPPRLRCTREWAPRAMRPAFSPSLYSVLRRTSAIAQRAQMISARGKGAGMGGAGHGNNPIFTFSADWNKNKWKGWLFVGGITTLGCVVPVACMVFAQNKAGVDSWGVRG